MSKYVVQAGWEDAPHLSPEARAELIDSYPPHERDARTRGIPQLGSGAIYPVPESEFTIDPITFPDHWKHVFGLDVGWNRTAGIWGCWDTQGDIVYLYSEHYRGQAEPPIHAEAIKARGPWIPGVIDPTARNRKSDDGDNLLAMYQELGLSLSPAVNSVDTGLYEVWTRLSTGRLKVFKTLQSWLAEYRIYRRDEKGAIVKANDHLMDATRYLIMSGLDIAAFKPREMRAGRNFTADYDPFASMNQPRLRGGRPVAQDYDPYGRG